MYPILYKLQDQGYISDRQVKVGKNAKPEFTII